MWYPFKKINKQKNPICSVTLALYLIFLFPKEFSTLITPFSTLLTMHLPFIFKTFFFHPSLPFSYCPISFTDLTNFCKKLCYTLSLQSNFDQFDQIIPPVLKMPTLQKRQVTFLLKQIILSILIDSFTVGIVWFPLLWSSLLPDSYEKSSSGYFFSIVLVFSLLFHSINTGIPQSLTMLVFPSHSMQSTDYNLYADDTQIYNICLNLIPGFQIQITN